MGSACQCTGEPQDVDDANTQALLQQYESQPQNDDMDDLKTYDTVDAFAPQKDPMRPFLAEAKETVITEERPPPFEMLASISDSPTVLPSQNFWVSRDCTNINNLITKMRQEEIKKGLVNILCFRSGRQRMRVRDYYYEKFRSNLMEDIRASLRDGKTRKLLIMLLQTPAEIIAEEIGRALDNKYLVRIASILVSLVNRQITEVIAAYATARFSASLLDDVTQASNDEDLKRLFTNLLTPEKRTETPPGQISDERMEEEARKLVTAFETNKMTPENKTTVIDVLTCNGWHEIAVIQDKYRELSQRTILEAMDRNRFKAQEAGAACYELVRFATMRHEQFADEIQNMTSLFGGVDEHALSQMIVLRSEIDLGGIMEAFAKEHNHNQKFEKWLQRHTQGTWRSSLSHLCGLNPAGASEGEPGAVSPLPSPRNSDDGLTRDVPSMADICTYADFADFCARKIGEKARESLWRKVDKDGNGVLDADEVNHLLNYTAVVYYTHKLKKEYGVDELDEKMRQEAPEFVEPIGVWILKNKLESGSLQLTKENFVENEVDWITEFAQLDAEGGAS